jgi:hypothetical protein
MKGTLTASAPAGSFDIVTALLALYVDNSIYNLTHRLSSSSDMDIK